MFWGALSLAPCQLQHPLAEATHPSLSMGAAISMTERRAQSAERRAQSAERPKLNRQASAVRCPPQKLAGTNNMVMTFTTAQTAAMRKVYPTTSPNRMRVTLRIGMAKNG